MMSRGVVGTNNKKEYLPMADKPYPWTCGNCAQKKVEPVIGDYATQFKHDGKLYDIVLSQVEIPTCQNCGTVQTGIEIGDKVTKALREQVGILSPEEIKQQRNSLGLSQGQLGECIGAAKESISRWETGALIQSVSTDRLLRMFFKHPADTVWKNNWLEKSSGHSESKPSEGFKAWSMTASRAFASPEKPANFFHELLESVERKLLSRLMVEDSLIPMVESRLKEDDFQNALLRYTYHSMLSIYHKSGKIVPRKLADALAVRTSELPAEPGEIVIFLVDTATPNTKIEELVDLMSRRSQIRRELSESF